jgi:hypothetical protein
MKKEMKKANQEAMNTYPEKMAANPEELKCSHFLSLLHHSSWTIYTVVNFTSFKPMFLCETLYFIHIIN